MRQNRFAVELFGYTQIIVRQWQIRRFTRLNRKRHTNDLRLHVIQTGGFGIKRKFARHLQTYQPRIEIGWREDGLVGCAGGDGGKKISSWCILFLPPLWGKVRKGGISGFQRCQAGAKFVTFVEFAQFVGVLWVKCQRFGGNR